MSRSKKIDYKKMINLAFNTKCPKCRKTSMFSSQLDLKDKCEECNLAIKNIRSDVGDGAVFFSILIVGAIVTIFAVLFEYYLALEPVTHAIIWTPVVIFGTVYTLRITKALIIELEYEVRKEEFMTGKKKKLSGAKKVKEKKPMPAKTTAKKPAVKKSTAKKVVAEKKPAKATKKPVAKTKAKPRKLAAKAKK